MELHIQHRWDVSPEEAQQIQRDLAARVHIEPLSTQPRTIGGIDVSFPQRDVARAAVVIVRFPELTPIAQATAERPVSFPYIPGLLSFRETPAVLDALDQLSTLPDLLICDAQGLAHPRRLGLAAHLGVLLDHPTIGCAKSRLIGRHEEPPPERGAYTWLYDGQEIIGAAVRTRDGVKPVYVSVGHRIDLPGAIQMTLACCTRYRLPEPTRLAHQVAAGRTVVPPGAQLSLF
ncbi:MAG: deoxyribonuclease V [Chloroflexi bacterium]|nr:deoxyribonuclease V [Chloroflexota bacterium]